MAMTYGKRDAERKRMKAAVAYLQKYMATYDKQAHYQDYTDETYINDVLYGLGASLDEKYKFADGFSKFKELLAKHIAAHP